MSDSYVLKAQVYLNAMFGGHEAWEELEENGNTGTATMKGIIRAFQIQNNVESVTGTVGSLTIAKMKSLPVISKMDPDDDSSINVCLIQCALFCKGYDAGGITGIYYTAGVAAVTEMQEDANIPVTGEIDWKVWMGLLSMNWFKLVSGGDYIIRTIQRQLNGDWSDIVGVGPCDGVVSRQTALSLVGALQAAEGVTTELITELNAVNFGDATTENFPDCLKSGQNSAEYIPFNKLVEYGLYINGYNPGRFDGIYDETTAEMVAEFQQFYALTGIDLVTEGEVNVSTMKSLLTSKGDTSRTAKACDCSTQLSLQQASDLKEAGYTHIGRYLTGYVGVDHIPKYLTIEELEYIQDVGLSLFPIYQDGGYELEYFQNLSQGINDAQYAILAAQRLGVPEGSVIYFAVDFDCYEYEMEDYIIPYFQKIKLFFCGDGNPQKYKIGIYAPRYVCTTVENLGLSDSSFVADMSTGYSCNLGFSLPANWAFDQFVEEKFISSPSFYIDKDGYSGRNEGINVFDKVEGMTTEEIEEENLKAEIEILRTKYIYNVLSPLGIADKIISLGFSYGKEIPLGSFVSGIFTVSTSVTISAEYEIAAETSYSFDIEVDSAGNLTAGVQNKIEEITTELDLKSIGIEDFVKEMLENIALSVQVGYMTVAIYTLTEYCTKIAITVNSGDLLQDDTSDIETGVSVKVDIEFSLSNDSGKKFNIATVEVKENVWLACIVIIMLFYGLGLGVATITYSVLLALLVSEGLFMDDDV